MEEKTNIWMYTKHGPRSMDHPCGPSPWATLWTVDLAHGPPHGLGPWTTLMDLVHGPALGLIFVKHVHALYISMVDCTCVCLHSTGLALFDQCFL